MQIMTWKNTVSQGNWLLCLWEVELLIELEYCFHAFNNIQPGTPQSRPCHRGSFCFSGLPLYILLIRMILSASIRTPPSSWLEKYKNSKRVDTSYHTVRAPVTTQHFLSFSPPYASVLSFVNRLVSIMVTKRLPLARGVVETKRLLLQPQGQTFPF